MEKITENPTIVKTSKEMGEAMKENKNTIIVEGDLAKKVIRIKATGTIAWVVAFGSIGAAVFAIISAPAATAVTAPAAGAGGAISFTGGAVATGAAGVILGPAAITAVTIAVAAGGVGVLTTLRDKYSMKKINNKKIILTKK